MKELSERQKNILEIVIREYIENAAPISSKFIEKKYNLGVSPATIRAELFELIEKGYLYQPHTSAGRVPTDKGYRFFVDFLGEKEIQRLENRLAKEIKRMQREVEGKAHFIREFTRFLAQSSSSLTISYFPRESILLKEGWKSALLDPEFEDVEKIHDFMGMVEDFEKNIDSFFGDKKEECIHVYIGSEAPFLKKHDFSVLISPCRIFKKRGLVAIMGPKRMAYDRNIYLVESIIKMMRD